MQSPQALDGKARPTWRDIAWLVPYAVRGTLELIRARYQFRNLSARGIVARNRDLRTDPGLQASVDPKVIARITYVLPRISDRLPWRSDCLVQALAGQNWLRARGLDSEIEIGVEHPEDGDFGAHAWLVCGEMVVTGGDIARYELLLSRQKVGKT